MTDESPWPVTQVRFARPTDKLTEVVEFYSGCLGFPELFRFTDHDGYHGVMLGLPGASYHLEFTSHANGSPGPAPTEENLLVLYFADEAAMRPVIQRLRAAGHAPVTLENPYWTANAAVGFADPDGWRVVLVPRPGL